MPINGIDGATKATRIKGLYDVRTTAAGHPTNPVAGETYFNSDTGQLFRWDNINNVWRAWPYTSTSTTTTSSSTTTTSTSTTTTSSSTSSTTVTTTSTTL